ncbi:MAG: nuclear transport factor 2 family protein [Massilia sp.]
MLESYFALRAEALGSKKRGSKINFLIVKTLALQAVDYLSQRRIDRLSALFHDDAVMAFPYAPEGFFQRLEGREAINKSLQRLSDLFSQFEIKPTRAVSDESGDVMVEAESIATLADGSPYRNRDHRDSHDLKPVIFVRL